MTLVLRVIIANLENGNRQTLSKKVFKIDLNWRNAALDDEDLKPFWDSLQATLE
jgi:hypothetical protein